MAASPRSAAAAATNTHEVASTVPLDRGTSVAFLSSKFSWIQGTVDSFDPRTNVYVCTGSNPENPAERETEKVKNSLDQLFAPRAEYLEEDVNDLLMLTELHEATLLFCLKRRYMRDVVYTNIGPIVVALNPFTFNIPWYKDDKMSDYLTEGSVIENNLPHSWAVAHNTYWEMRENRQNQTILISGESGAGKTEGAKIVVKYVGELSTMHGTAQQREACAQVNRRVNAASPILESFGNAKTVRNDNSSRFGKFMKIQFDKDGFLIGSFATKYLLEKSRIITASKDERVYHSFYQLRGGEDGKKFGIRPTTVLKSIKSGDCEHIEGVDEAASFAEVKQAFFDVGISEDEQLGVWRVCAGILFFQNVEFVEKFENNVRAAELDGDFVIALDKACDLWGVHKSDLERELLRQTSVQRNETVVRRYDKPKAIDTRDSVSKGLYSWLFDWLVARINQTTDCEARCAQWIGLLDIFGFEDFTHNYFEQLCINLANETLQSHYNFFIFTEDMRECREEGIDTTHVTFADNKPCIEMLSGAKNSVFSTLDDECKMGSGTDAGFLAKLLEKFQTTKTNPGNPFFVACTGKLQDAAFKIRHYAGDVTYLINNILEKNRDSLKEAIKEILHKSTVPIIPPIVPPLDDPSRPVVRPTVSAYFSKQLQDLMAVINQTNPHWIRCVKPHPMKKPRMFNHANVIAQLRSAGVLATVKIRQGGYPIRFPKGRFLERYKAILVKDDGNPDADPTAVIKSVFERLGIDASIGQLGKTKVFLRQRGFMELNSAKDAATRQYAALLQRVGRGRRAREALFAAFYRKHRLRLEAEAKAREEAARRQREAEEARRKAEAEERRRREEAEKVRRDLMAKRIQRRVRGMLARLKVARFFIETLRASEERRADENFARFRHMVQRVSAGLRQVEMRSADGRARPELSAALYADGSVGPMGPLPGDDGGGKSNAYEDMIERRRQLIEKRKKHMQQAEEKARQRALEQDKKIRTARERARNEAREQVKVKEAAEQMARKERQKALAAKAESDEARLAAAAERRAEAIRQVERRRQEIDQHQLRVMMDEARAAAELHAIPTYLDSREPLVPSSTSARPRVAGTTTTDHAFEAVKRDWVAEQRWAVEREQRMAAAARDEAWWLRNHDHKLRYHQQAAAAHVPPRYPNLGLSPVYDELEALRRPRAEDTSAPSALTARELRLEAAFREAQALRMNDSDAAEQLHSFMASSRR